MLQHMHHTHGLQPNRFHKQYQDYQGHFDSSCLVTSQAECRKNVCHLMSRKWTGDPKISQTFPKITTDHCLFPLNHVDPSFPQGESLLSSLTFGPNMSKSQAQNPIANLAKHRWQSSKSGETNPGRILSHRTKICTARHILVLWGANYHYLTAKEWRWTKEQGNILAK